MWFLGRLVATKRMQSTQDPPEDFLFGVGRAGTDADAAGTFLNPISDLEHPTTRRVHFEFLPRGPVKVISQHQEHLVSHTVQQQAEQIGQKTMAVEAVHLQVELEGLNEVFRLTSVGVILVQ